MAWKLPRRLRCTQTLTGWSLCGECTCGTAAIPWCVNVVLTRRNARLPLWSGETIICKSQGWLASVACGCGDTHDGSLEHDMPPSSGGILLLYLLLSNRRIYLEGTCINRRGTSTAGSSCLVFSRQFCFCCFSSNTHKMSGWECRHSPGCSSFSFPWQSPFHEKFS